jgi:serine/threonine protein phosphatase PrpC
MTTETATGVDAFGLTDIGKVRTNNEDHFIIATLRKSVALELTSIEARESFDRLLGSSARLFIVADGVGGRPGGELASGSAVESLVQYIAQMAGCFNNADVDVENEFLMQLEHAVERAHERILAELGAGGHGPSTTLTMAILIGVRAYIVHVGDSRAYYLHGGRLRQLTADQTTGQYMVDVGAWTEDQAARAGVGANLISAVGGSEMLPKVGLVDLAPGDTLLLCTDGLTKHVADEQITAMLLRGDGVEATAKALVQTALDAGGTDNVTVVLARMNA